MSGLAESGRSNGPEATFAAPQAGSRMDRKRPVPGRLWKPDNICHTIQALRFSAAYPGEPGRLRVA
jgi:hypothetical protein